MPSLPTIPSVASTTQAASPQINFSDAFLMLLHFFAATVRGLWTCKINTRNYHAATGTLAPDTPENNHSVTIDDVAGYAATHPTFGQVLAAVLVVTGMVQPERVAQSALDAVNKLPANDPTKAAKLAAAQTAYATAAAPLQTPLIMIAAQIAAGAIPDSDPHKAAKVAAYVTAVQTATQLLMAA